MEKIPETTQTVEFFEKVLNINTTDINMDEFKKNKSFVFGVTPEYNILLSNVSHNYLEEKYGLDLDRSLTEGYLIVSDKDEVSFKKFGGIKINKNTYIMFKADRYQPVPGFKGSPEEFSNLKTAIKNKILDFINQF